MNNINSNNYIMNGITVIYFNDASKNIYAQISPDKEQAIRLSKRIFKDAMTAISTEHNRRNYLVTACFPNSAYSESGNST